MLIPTKKGRQQRAGFGKQWIQFYVCITGVVILKLCGLNSVTADEEVVNLIQW